jgi:hypothetical protein
LPIPKVLAQNISIEIYELDSMEQTSSHPNSCNTKIPLDLAREQRSNNNRVSYNISPIYTDLSDVDISDDDPTINFENLLNKPTTKRNLLFERPNSYSSDSDCDKQNYRKGRKRSRKVNKWQQNTSKRLRNKGKSYVSMTKTRKTVPARYIKNACTAKCKLKCTTNIDSDGKYKIFSDFWGLSDLVAQRAYIRTCMN